MGTERTTEAPQRVFLSYSRRDRRLVESIHRLLDAGGGSVWRDAGIEPGSVWRIEVTRAIESCDRMMVFWCYHAKASTEVEKEYREAFRRGKRVVPVRLDRTALPTSLSHLHALDETYLGRTTHRLDRIAKVAFGGAVLSFLTWFGLG